MEKGGTGVSFASGLLEIETTTTEKEPKCEDDGPPLLVLKVPYILVFVGSGQSCRAYCRTGGREWNNNCRQSYSRYKRYGNSVLWSSGGRRRRTGRRRLLCITIQSEQIDFVGFSFCVRNEFAKLCIPLVFCYSVLLQWGIQLGDIFYVPL